MTPTERFLGVPVPMNSVGILNLELIDALPKVKYQAACNNLKQASLAFEILFINKK